MVLRVAALDSSGATNDLRTMRLTSASALQGTPHWSPDGHYVAIFLNYVPNCEITIFASTPPHTEFRRVAILTSDAFYNHNLCFAGISDWSADSTHLRVIARGTPPVEAITDVDVASLLRTGDTASLDIAPAAFHAVDAGIPIPVGGWYPSTMMYVYTDDWGRTLKGVDPKTGKVSVLLAMPAAVAQRIEDFAWTADGRQLFVVVNAPTCVDCGVVYRSEVYLYTPPFAATPEPASLKERESPR
jgi:hypothetical protein